MKNTEDTFTITVVSNGIGALAGVIQGLISEAHVLNPSIASGLALAKITGVSVAAEGFTVVIAVQSGDPDRIGKASTAAVASIVLSTIGAIGVGAAGLTALPAIAVVGLSGAAGSWLGKQIWESYKESFSTGIAPPPTVVMPEGITDFDDWSIPGGISSTTNTCFRDAKNWTPPRDPLVLDLDGDGIEAIGIDPNAPVLFDMDGDGVKTATGWIKSDDGNGLIDSGRELFGDATVLQRGPRAGQLAANGFEALADLDANADGRLDSLDASWGQLRVWRDLNQDGVSQAGELTTLAAQGIASLGAQGTQSNFDLGNGNTQVLSGSFTRTNGTLGASDMAEVAGSLLLASNGFYREFTDDPQITQHAQSLPKMQGSGLVRDLREAMSLGTAQAGALQAAVAMFAAGKKWNGNAPELIAGYARRSCPKCRFDAKKRVSGRRKPTGSADGMSAALRMLRLAVDARVA